MIVHADTQTAGKILLYYLCIFNLDDKIGFNSIGLA